jgi:hypothetical protein
LPAWRYAAFACDDRDIKSPLDRLDIKLTKKTPPA